NCFFPPPTRGGKNVNNTMFLNDFGYNIAVPFEKRLIFITFPSYRLGKSTRVNLLLMAVLNRNSYIFLPPPRSSAGGKILSTDLTHYQSNFNRFHSSQKSFFFVARQISLR
ncbi:MAG: hypothetical protein LBR79_01400, partial [Oscillospiraceae bacterium]|nr:hypothetical protein [Oscillospiraceae bacterium]